MASGLNRIVKRFFEKIDTEIMSYKCFLFLTSVFLFSFIYAFGYGIDDFDWTTDEAKEIRKNREKKNRNDFMKRIPFSKDMSSGMYDWFTILYFSFMVQSTVGLGDIIPKPLTLKILVMIQIFVTVIIVSV